MSQRIELQPSYILHTRPYRDTSLLVDILTMAQGKVSLVAKGARRAKNNQRHLLQPFIPLLVSWQGKSSLKTLTNIEVSASDAYREMNLQGKHLYSAMYANELLVYLLTQDAPSGNVFHYYTVLLTQLAKTDVDIEISLRDFEFRLLDELGYGINFVTEADSDEALQAHKHYYWIDNHGFVEVINAPKKDGIVFQGDALINIASQDYSDKTTRLTAKILSRTALNTHLKGRPLKSRELFTAMVLSE